MAPLNSNVIVCFGSIADTPKQVINRDYMIRIFKLLITSQLIGGAVLFGLIYSIHFSILIKIIIVISMLLITMTWWASCIEKIHDLPEYAIQGREWKLYRLILICMFAFWFIGGYVVSRYLP